MSPLKSQYFLSFAAMGAILPYVPVFLRDRGLSEPQVGYVQAAASMAVLSTPILSLLADLHSVRLLLAAAFIMGGSMLLAVWAAETFAAILILYAIHRLFFVTLSPLQDGLNFTIQSHRQRQSLPPEPYYRVRFYGTLGYLVPTIPLYFLLAWRWPSSITLIAGTVFCFIGAINTIRIHAPPDPLLAPRRLPTLSAASALFRRPLLPLSLALGLLHFASSGFFTFYPVFLRDRLGIDTRWIGLISNLGVIVEVIFILSFGRLCKRCGEHRILLACAVATAMRFLSLALVPTTASAIFNQFFHGFSVLALLIFPPQIINDHAAPEFRHSIQGVYAMLLVGIPQIAGNLIAGRIADRSYTLLFALSGLVALLASLLIGLSFRNRLSVAATPADA